MLWAFAIAVLGIIAAYVVGQVYEPDLPDRPPPADFSEAIGQVLADALGYALAKVLAIMFVLFLTAVVLFLLVVLTIPFLVAPFSRFLNALTKGHAFAGFGLLLGVIALLFEFV